MEMVLLVHWYDRSTGTMVSHWSHWSPGPTGPTGPTGPGNDGTMSISFIKRLTGKFTSWLPGQTPPRGLTPANSGGDYYTLDGNFQSGAPLQEFEYLFVNGYGNLLSIQPSFIGSFPLSLHSNANGLHSGSGTNTAGGKGYHFWDRG